MTGFIILTRGGDHKVYIAIDRIDAFSEHGEIPNMTSIWAGGDTNEFLVKETPEHIMELIEDVVLNS